MIYTLLGIEDLDYVSKKTGKKVQGCNIYVGQRIQKGRGQKGQSFYLSASSDAYAEVCEMPIGIDIELYFNQYGHIIKIIEA